MKYKDWCKNSKAIIQEAEDFNTWRKEKKHFLLTEIGPRIASLGKTGYYGCGFHYDMERHFAALIREMAIPWQPSANHCDKVEEDKLNTIMTKVLFNALISDIEEAEKTR